MALDIEPFTELDNEGMGAIGYSCRGHVDKQAFVDELLADWGVAKGVDEVRHSYYHYVPTPRPLGERGMIIERLNPGRGRYPVTVVGEFCG